MTTRRTVFGEENRDSPASPSGSSKTAKVVIAAAAFAAILLYLGAVVLWYVAERSAQSLTTPGLLLAARLAPDNAEHQFQLGNLFTFAELDAARGLPYYRRAVELNPHSARYWLALANACLISGDAENQRKSLEEALRAAPNSTLIAADVATFYVVRGDTRLAFPLYRKVLQYDPRQLPSILPSAWSAVPDPDFILDNLLPPEAEIHSSFLAYLIEHKERAAADRAWARLLREGLPLTMRAIVAYFDDLIARNDNLSLEREWNALVAGDARLRDHAVIDGIVNGGFEEDLLNGGRDWRMQRNYGVAMLLDTLQFHSGLRSLQLTFDGPAVEDIGVAQAVPLKPQTELRLVAFIRGTEVTSGSAPRLAVVGSNGEILAKSDEFLGTFPWREVRLDFRTGVNPDIGRVVLLRDSKGYRISGTLWIDSVSLVGTR